MKKLISLMMFLMVSFLWSSCQKNGPNPDLQPVKIDLPLKAGQVIAGSNEFGIGLFTRIAAQDDGNLMISPLSASINLTMLLNGCQENTYEEIKQMLGYPSDMSIEEINESYLSLVSQLIQADEKVKLHIANAMFYRNGFFVKEPFVQTLSEQFTAQVQGLDFSSESAINTINQWAADNTNDRINKVIDQIPDETVMFLMNALYFKGDWTKKFDKALTTDKDFRLGNGQLIQVPAMFESEMKALYYEHQNFEALEIPYGRKNFSMILLLPSGTLNELYTQLDPATWAEVTSAFDKAGDWTDVMVTMPKFKFEYEKYMNAELADMGMVEAFDPQLANLNNISDADLVVSFVKQNTFVEVNEEGTEAAAVTTTGIDAVSMGPIFTIDKPFVFAIRERTTNALLFIGSVANPLN
jgi:serpin B